MMTDGYAVNTESVEEYIQNVVVPAHEMFEKIVGWLEEKNPQKYGPELLVGTHPELPGKPTEFWEACNDFIGHMLDLFNIILQKEHEVVNTLGLLVTNGRDALAAYRKQDAEAAGFLNGILQQLTEGRSPDGHGTR